MAVSYNSKTKRFRLEFDKIINGERIRKTKILPKSTSRQEALAYDEKYESEMYKAHVLYGSGDKWINYVNSIKDTWIPKTVRQLRYRAKLKSIECDIDAHALEAMLIATGGRCELTGVSFNKNRVAERSPYMFSVDRINSKKGYTINNCRLICYAANIALQNWGENVFNDMAVGYVFNKYSGFVKRL